MFGPIKKKKENGVHKLSSYNGRALTKLFHITKPLLPVYCILHNNSSALTKQLKKPFNELPRKPSRGQNRRGKKLLSPRRIGFVFSLAVFCFFFKHRSPSGWCALEPKIIPLWLHLTCDTVNVPSPLQKAPLPRRTSLRDHCQGSYELVGGSSWPEGNTFACFLFCVCVCVGRKWLIITT